jgi:hypothetical protein
VGVGAAIALTIANIDSSAYGEDGVIINGANNIILEIDSTSQAQTESEAGAAGGMATVPVLAFGIILSQGRVGFGKGNKLQLGGNLIAKARNISKSETKASAVMAGSKVAVGAAVAIDINNNKTLASTARNIEAGGAVTFHAQGAARGHSNANAGSKGGSSESDVSDDDPDGADGDESTSGIDEMVNGFMSFMNGMAEKQGIEKEKSEEDPDAGSIPEKTPQSAETSEGGVNVAGAVALNIVTSTIEAYIPSGVSIVAGGPLNLKASHNTDSAAIADGSAVDPESAEAGGKIGVGVAVAINVATTKALAYIDEGADIKAGGLNIIVGMTEIAGEEDAEGNPTTDKVNTHKVEAISGAGASNVGVAGGAAINVLVTDALAYTDSPVEITAVGGADSDVVITAASASEGTVNAGAAIKNTGEEAKVGFGASVVINIISNSVKAYIADGIALSGAISDVILGAELESQTEAKAESGAGSTSATSINGAVALNVSISSVEAYLGISSEALNAGGDVTVSARNINQVSGEASGVAAGSKVGIGIALVINVVTDKTLATTKRNIRADGSVSFKAEGASGSSTTAKAGTNGGEEEKEEDDEGGSDGNADTSGIDEKINKLLGFLNKTSEEKGIEKKASDGDEGKIPEKTPQKAETSEGGVNVAGALAVNIVSSSIEAYIPTGIVIISGGKLTIKASSNTDAEAKADGSAVKADKNSPAKVGVGVAVAINVANTKTLAYIESGATVTAGGLYIAAIMTELPAEESGSDPDVTNEYTAEAVSGAGSGKIGVAGSVALNIVNSETAAYTASSVTIIPVAEAGDVSIIAASAYKSTSTAGTSVKMEEDEAQVGVGASFASNIINTKVLAYLANNVNLTGAANLIIDSDLASEVETTATAGADPIEDLSSTDSGSEAKIGLDAAVALSIVNNENRAYIGSGCNVDTSGNVEIKADSKSTTDTTAEGNSSGSKVAVGAAVGVNVIDATTEAALKGNASIGGSLTVEANTENRDDVFTLATARGLSIERYINKFKKSADDILNGNFGNDGGSSKKKPASAKALDDYNVKTAQVRDQEGGTTGENSQESQKICIAAAVGVNVSSHNTWASTIGGAITVGGNVLVNANSRSDSIVLGTGAAVGDGNSIGVGVAVSVINNKTSAGLGSTNANGHNINVKAVSSQNMSEEYRSKLAAEALAGAGTGQDGKIGAAGAVAVVTSNAITEAYIAPDAVISDAGVVNILAEETSKLAVRAWGATAGGAKVGIGAAFAIIYANNQINAYVGSDTEVTAQELNIKAEKKRVDMSDFSIGFDFEENEFTKNIFEGLELLNFIACNNYYGDAIAGSAQSGDAAIAGAFVVIVLNNATNAYIGDGAVLNIRGNINIDSKSDVNAKAFGGAVAFANKAGVGITTVNIINFDAVRAYIGDEAIVISDGNIRIVADADQEFTIISVSAPEQYHCLPHLFLHCLPHNTQIHSFSVH